jgi:hypothetical protein
MARQGRRGGRRRWRGRYAARLGDLGFTVPDSWMWILGLGAAGVIGYLLYTRKEARETQILMTAAVPTAPALITIASKPAPLLQPVSMSAGGPVNEAELQWAAEQACQGVFDSQTSPNAKALCIAYQRQRLLAERATRMAAGYPQGEQQGASIPATVYPTTTAPQDTTADIDAWIRAHGGGTGLFRDA